MRNRPEFLALLALTAISGCRDEPGVVTQAKPAAQAIELPFLTGSDGTVFPYFEYQKDDLPLRDSHEDELAVFVHPIFADSRNRGLALPHARAEEVKDLFCCGELFGHDFSVVLEQGILSIDDLPVSRPVDLKAGAKWKMTYVDDTYDCGVARQVGADFVIACASDKFVLNHRFDNQRGFTSFQDRCGQAPDRPATEVCTYNLQSSVGLLSPYHVRLLAEPSRSGTGAP